MGRRGGEEPNGAPRLLPRSQARLRTVGDRADCQQRRISYETFDGNRTDVSTRETILRMLERKYGKARRIWVFDRGIVSEENLAAIRQREGQYLTATPRSQMKQLKRSR
jgi:hypothetical protein